MVVAPIGRHRSPIGIRGCFRSGDPPGITPAITGRMKAAMPFSGERAGVMLAGLKSRREADPLVVAIFRDCFSIGVLLPFSA